MSTIAQLQIGNEIGICAVDKPDDTLLATIVTDTANGFTVSAADIVNLRVGMVIDIVTKTTGATGAGALGRIIQSIDSVTNTVVYTGADLTLTTAFGVYLTGQWELAAPAAGTGGTVNDGYANVNGGPSFSAGFNLNGRLSTIQALRERLAAINATTYSNAELNKMTLNDMVYAVRLSDAPGSVK